MTLFDTVRKEARRRGAKKAAAPGDLPPGAWKEAEQAVVAEIRNAPRAALRLVGAYARLAKADGSQEALGRASRLRGSWCSFMGRDRESLTAYAAAERRLTGLAADGARLGRTTALVRLGRFADARRVCAAIRRSARRRSDTFTEGLADLNDGGALLESGRAAVAIPILERARAAFRTLERPQHAADAAHALANALVLVDRFDDAEGFYDEAARGYATVGAAAQASRGRMNRGWLLVLTERLGEADADLRACEATFRLQGDTLHAAMSRRDRGEALLRAGLVPEARHAFASSMRGLASAPPVERARTALLLARAALAEGDPAGAVAALRAAPRSVLDAAEAAEVRGRAAAIERSADARRLLVRAADTFGDARPAGRSRCLSAAAWATLEARQFDDAARLASEAGRIADRLGIAALQFAARAVRFLAEADAGHRVAADAALSEASDALESVRSGLGPDAMRAALLRGREAWLARAVRHLSEGPDGARRALAFLERWRARSLLDLLGDAGAGARPGSDRVAALRRVAAALERRAEGARLPGFLRGAVAAPPALVRRLREVERELLDATARDAAPAARAPDEDEVGRIAASLPDRTLLVVLCDDDRGSLAFVRRTTQAQIADGTGAARDTTRIDRVHGPAPSSDAALAVRDLHFALGAATLGPAYVGRHGVRIDRAVAAALARLSNLLLVPLGRWIDDADRIVVVPHGPWHHVPFAALPWRGRPLVEHAAVTLVPALAVLRDPPPAATGRSAVFAVPDEAAPAVGVEAVRVAASLGAELVAGESATAAALEALDRPACLHVAAHGRHRPDAPAASGVRLADGWFRAAEFARLRLAGSLVVLSGCETGMTAIDAGDEPHGLVRGVLAAGATDVVSSLWRIDDDATARFMERFHELRAAGSAPSAALTAVQRERAAADAPPWHWAGFVHHARRI